MFQSVLTGVLLTGLGLAVWKAADAEWTGRPLRLLLKCFGGLAGLTGSAITLAAIVAPQ